MSRLVGATSWRFPASLPSNAVREVPVSIVQRTVQITAHTHAEERQTPGGERTSSMWGQVARSSRSHTPVAYYLVAAGGVTVLALSIGFAVLRNQQARAALTAMPTGERAALVASAAIVPLSVEALTAALKGEPEVTAVTAVAPSSAPSPSSAASGRGPPRKQRKKIDPFAEKR